MSNAMEYYVPPSSRALLYEFAPIPAPRVDRSSKSFRMHDAAPHKPPNNDWFEFGDTEEYRPGPDPDDDNDTLHTPRTRRLMLFYRLRHRLSLYFYDLRMRMMAIYNRRQRRRAAAKRRRESNRVYIVEAPAKK
jgi:hypothetical protein